MENGEKVPLKVVVRHRDCYEALGKYMETVSFNMSIGPDGMVRFEIEPIVGCDSFQTEVWKVAVKEQY